MRLEDLIAVVPSEAGIVVIVALGLAIGVIWLLMTLGSRNLPYVKAMTEATVKIPGFNFTLKGGGLLVLFVVLFVLIVVLYLVLRIIPGTP